MTLERLIYKQKISFEFKPCGRKKKNGAQGRT